MVLFSDIKYAAYTKALLKPSIRILDETMTGVNEKRRNNNFLQSLILRQIYISIFIVKYVVLRTSKIYILSSLRTGNHHELLQRVVLLYTKVVLISLKWKFSPVRITSNYLVDNQGRILV